MNEKKLRICIEPGRLEYVPIGVVIINGT